MSSVIPTVNTTLAPLAEGLGDALSAAEAEPASTAPSARVATAVAARNRVGADGLRIVILRSPTGRCTRRTDL